MATNRKRQRTKRKKNPSTAQWAVLGVGGAIGLGLLSYGGYLAWQNRKAQALPPGGFEGEGGAPSGPMWNYTVRRVGQDLWQAFVQGPDGETVPMGSARSYQESVAIAQGYIRERGGTPVPRRG